MKMTIQKQVTETFQVSRGDTLLMEGNASDILIASFEGQILAISLDSGNTLFKSLGVQELLGKLNKKKIVGVKKGSLCKQRGYVNLKVTRTVPEEVDIRVGSLITYESEKRLVVSAGGRFHSVDPDNFASQGNYATIAELVHQGRYIYGTIKDVQKVQL